MNSTYLEAIKDLVRRIRDPKLRNCVEELIADPRMRVCGDVEPRIELLESPAAPRKHHMYRGGLLQHTYSVARIAMEIAKVVKEIYSVEIDMDLVIATAVLHDIYKYYQYEFDDVERCFKPRRDWYLSHDYAVVAEVAKRGCPSRLVRALSEVHGTVPITTIEGLVVHLADSVDARIGEFLQGLVIELLKVVEQRYGCKHTQLLDELVSRMGFNEVLRKAIQGELQAIAENVCKEMMGATDGF